MRGRTFVKYSRQIRYGLFFLTLFLMIFSIKRYLGDFNIEKEIASIKNQISDVQQKDEFMRNFYKNYLSGTYSQMFFAHENGIALNGEKIIKFGGKESLPQDNIEVKKDTTQTQNNDITRPADAWKYFLDKKYKTFKDSL